MLRFERTTALDQDSPVRVVLVGRDRRFLHVAREFIGRSGYTVLVTDRPCELLDTIERARPTVVVVDGSDYLATAVRNMTTMDAVSEPVGVVTVVEERELSPLTEAHVLPKWGSFTRLIREIERVHAERAVHLEPSLG